MKRWQIRKTCAVGLALGLIGIPAAYAGFVNEAAQTVAPPVPPLQIAALTPGTSAQPGSVPAPAAAPTLAAAPVAASAPVPPQASDTAAQPAPVSDTQPRVVQIGTRPAVVRVAQGGGRGIMLSDMLPAIAPHDFMIDVHGQSGEQPVTWHGGKPWDLVLSDALSSAPGVRASIDWNRRVVSLRASPSSPAIAATNDPAVPEGTQKAVAMRWEVRFSDVTLRQALIRWAKDAGWQVSWEIPYDYPVQLEASFTGSFEDAVTQFLGSLRNSDYPALGCMYDANRVVRVLHYGDKQECEK